MLLWRASGERMLGSSARAAILRALELSFSVVSLAEIGVKASSGKLVIPGDLQRHILDSGVRVLGLRPEHALAVASLPPHRRDPFDRLLISQARAEGLTIVTADKRFTDLLGTCFARGTSGEGNFAKTCKVTVFALAATAVAPRKAPHATIDTSD